MITLWMTILAALGCGQGARENERWGTNRTKRTRMHGRWVKWRRRRGGATTADCAYDEWTTPKWATLAESQEHVTSSHPLYNHHSVLGCKVGTEMKIVVPQADKCGGTIAPPNEPTQEACTSARRQTHQPEESDREELP